MRCRTFWVVFPFPSYLTWVVFLPPDLLRNPMTSECFLMLGKRIQLRFGLEYTYETLR